MKTYAMPAILGMEIVGGISLYLWYDMDLGGLSSLESISMNWDRRERFSLSDGRVRNLIELGLPWDTK